MTYSPNLGRWLQQDPIGYTAADDNLYRYLENDPVSAVDPLGLYDADVHFYMTYYIAKSLGLDNCSCDLKRNEKKTSAAFAIAWADNYTDYNSKTQPFLGVDVRRRFHFRTSGDKVVAGSDEAAAIAKDGVAKCDPLLMGIGLHALQDSFSHAGFGPRFGHGLAGHDPDDPSQDVKKAMDMAKATYDMLADYLRKCCKKDPNVKWDDIAAKIEKVFDAGKPDQGLSYKDQIPKRIDRWKGLLGNGAPTYSDKGKQEPWAESFEKSAGTVELPKKK